MDRARVYLDANIFIEAMETPELPWPQDVWRFLDASRKGEIQIVTSELTLAEVLVQPLRRGDAALCDAYRDLISPSEAIEVVGVGRAILGEAARRRAEQRSLKLPDAIHVATALACGLHYFVTRDSRIPNIDSLVRLGGPEEAFARIYEDRP